MPVPVQMNQRGVSAHNRQPFRLFFLFLFFFPAVTDRTFRREEEDAELRFTLRVLRTGLLTASIGVLDTILTIFYKKTQISAFHSSAETCALSYLLLQS